MPWSFSQSRCTDTESEQFEDGRARVSNRFGMLEVMRDTADAEWDCWTPSVARHISNSCAYIEGPSIKSVTKKGDQLGEVGEGRDQSGDVN